MAAEALIKNDVSGIMRGLPLAKAKKLLINNRLEKKTKRSKYFISAREKARDQAFLILPYLAALFQRNLPNYRPPRINQFCLWIVKVLNDRSSEANNYAVFKGFDELLDANRNVRWWQDQIKKMQS